MEHLLLLLTTAMELLMKLAVNTLSVNIGFTLSVMALAGLPIALAKLIQAIKA